MNRFIFILFLLAVTASAAIAFSLINGGEFVPAPPPRSLPEAYAIALQALNSATNNYYCVGAKIGCEWCYAGEWVFTFDKNYMQHRVVYVAMKSAESFNPAIHLKPWPLTEVRDTGVDASVNLDPANSVSNKRPWPTN